MFKGFFSFALIFFPMMRPTVNRFYLFPSVLITVAIMNWQRKTGRASKIPVNNDKKGHLGLHYGTLYKDTLEEWERSLNQVHNYFPCLLLAVCALFEKSCSCFQGVSKPVRTARQLWNMLTNRCSAMSLIQTLNLFVLFYYYFLVLYMINK